MVVSSVIHLTLYVEEGNLQLYSLATLLNRFVLKKDFQVWE